ncbi:UNVERIFIED_CONTAM: peptidoglycan/xylan/chitin deacetylase (PgdA/CDA1 family) [Brevibacillus sp. OAP136]
MAVVKQTGRSFLKKALVLATALVLLAGTGTFDGRADSAATTKKPAPAPQKIVRYTGQKSKAISMVYTTRRELALTFNGLGDEKKMKQLLDDLDKYQIKATFFLPGNKLAKQPAIAKTILARGHEIESNTMNQQDLTKLPYEKVYTEIKAGNELIKQKAGITPRYVRTTLATYNDDVRLGAAHNGMQAVIGYSLFLHNWEKETPEQKNRYIRKYINRGGIIALDIEENRDLPGTIPLIAKAAADVGYKFVTLQKLIEQGGERKPLEAIEGYNAAVISPNYSDATYKLMYRKETDKKEVAITIDDWGSDYTVTKILDILAKEGVKATFFLRADGTEKNPNLARAMVEAGHDVGNHTYSHPIGTTIPAAQLQEEIVKAHRIITEAIQQKPAMIFRPPAGAYDESTLKAIGATGYHTIAMFDVIPSDHDRSKTAEEIVKTVVDKTQNGSLILLHMLDDTHTIEALPVLIKQLRSKGYTFVKMSEMVAE